MMLVRQRLEQQDAGAGKKSSRDKDALDMITLEAEEQDVRNIIDQMYGQRDLDSEEIELTASNPVASSLAYDRNSSEGERQAKEWLGKCRLVFNNPEFLDQAKFFSFIVGNEDQYGYRNIIMAGQEEERKTLHLIDLGASFRFLHRPDLDWTYAYQRFRSILHQIMESAPRLFVQNIKYLAVNFSLLPERMLDEMLSEFRKGNLRPEEKEALRSYMLAIQKVLKEEFLKLRVMPGPETD